MVGGMATLRPVAPNLDQLLKSVPPGAWVAISRDQERVVAYAAELKDAIRKAHDVGENHPVIGRAPLSSETFLC